MLAEGRQQSQRRSWHGEIKSLSFFWCIKEAYKLRSDKSSDFDIKEIAEHSRMMPSFYNKTRQFSKIHFQDIPWHKE